MIEIKNLRKTYGKKVALKSFSYTFEDGIYGMLGANGAGKSTLMNLLTDNVKRDSGEILYDGENGTWLFWTLPSAGRVQSRMFLSSAL